MIRIGFCCDAGQTQGMGHLMRCLALAEELAGRGLTPVFVAGLAELPWARAQLASRGFSWVAPEPDPVRAILSLDVSAVVLDSYELPATVSAQLRDAGLPVLAVVDGDTRGQVADLYVDQNLGAEADLVPVPAESVRLAGLRYALHRREILRYRPAVPRDPDHQPPRVLAFFGGTDPFGAAPVLAASLAGTGVACHATFVAASPQLAAAVRAVPLPAVQRWDVIPLTDRLPSLIAEADLVVAASGTSAWELACLGAAAALVCVVDNQRLGYGRAVATGAVAGLGCLADLRGDPRLAGSALRALLTGPERRLELRQAAWRLVDGRGRVRVADALLKLAAAGRVLRPLGADTAARSRDLT
jgi:spore coat polysaccharide biosynthesis predicted glycosyltransferase SpsG